MFVRLTDGRSYDSKYPEENNTVKNIEVMIAGLIITNDDSDGSQFFYPWHMVEFIAGTPNEQGHELDIVRLIGAMKFI